MAQSVKQPKGPKNSAAAKEKLSEDLEFVPYL